MIIFRIGSDDKPASQQDIDDFMVNWNLAVSSGQAMVTHHLVSVLEVPDSTPPAIAMVYNQDGTTQILPSGTAIQPATEEINQDTWDNL